MSPISFGNRSLWLLALSFPALKDGACGEEQEPGSIDVVLAGGSLVDGVRFQEGPNLGDRVGGVGDLDQGRGAGHEQQGQPIDLAFVIVGEGEPPEDYDWGDAPDPFYPTLAASNGAAR